MLAVMMSLHPLLETCWFIPRSESFFHFLFSGLHRSLTREQSDCANEHPSLSPLTPSGVPLKLRMDGLPKSGCLRTSATVVGFDLVRPGLTLSQAPIMFFHIEHCSLLSLGATRSQLKSRLLGPLPWTGSLVWSALCFTSSFQGSPPGARPLTSSLARRASDWNFGSITPSDALLSHRAKPTWGFLKVKLRKLWLSSALPASNSKKG